ncbi:hypothetical protein QTN47_02890 [Danxiaibacter flavus]|uniref:Pentapeptide repeat-containing protein n=1 Tax=Danxiaibacter flavus TaxID=3049108 RepID=A0ABV3Z9Z6_9BACT|nr:hypothetical protein QNM32_02885 [Chitinophagaceae bacterium DXS]
MKQLRLTALLLLLLNSIYAQNDTIHPIMFGNKLAINNDNPPDNSQPVLRKITDKLIPYVNGKDFLLSVLPYDKIFEKLYSATGNVWFADSLFIDHCNFYNSPNPDPPYFRNTFFSSSITIEAFNNSGPKHKPYSFTLMNNAFSSFLGLNINNSYLDTLSISGCTGNMSFKNDTTDFVFLSNLPEFSDSSSTGSLWFENIRSLKDTSSILIEHSNLNGITFSNSGLNDITFVEDTLNATFIDSIFTSKDAASIVKSIFFNKCFINGSFNCKGSRIQNLYFVSCKFGPSASLADLRFDTLILEDCGKLPSGIAFSPIPNNKDCYLKIVRTDITASNFKYPAGLHLFFDDNEGTDDINNVYVSLLEKLKGEAKTESYKQVDIDYRNQLASRGGIVEKTLNFVNRTWWNYGYNKGRVIWISLILLLIFFFINLFTWQRLQLIYPVSSIIDKMEDAFENKNYVRHASLVFLYTSFIFFSFKIDFTKIRFGNLQTVAYFLLQYIAGLICLFFILNAILKV